MEKLESDLRDYAIDLVNRNVCAPHQLGDYLTGYLAQDALSGNGHLARIAASAEPQNANSADGGKTPPGQQLDSAIRGPRSSSGAVQYVLPPDLGVTPKGGWEESSLAGAARYQLVPDLGVNPKGGWDDSSPAGAAQYNLPPGLGVNPKDGWDGSPPAGASQYGLPPHLGVNPDGGWDDASPAGAADHKVEPSLTVEEFNDFAKLAKVQEYRLKHARDKKQQNVNPAERDELVKMQQRLGVTQTSKYDNATRHALQAGFIDMIRPYAVEAEQKYGIPAAVTIAQAIIESGYGVHIPTDVTSGRRSNNFFGVKPDKEGQAFVTSWTTEYNKKIAKYEPKLQPFAVYDNFGGSVEEHSAFLKRNTNYNSLFSTSDPEKWADGLQKAGYAGDNPKYANTLKSAMRMWKLIK